MRPIALLAAPLRVWAKKRREQVEAWERDTVVEEHWGCEGKPVDMAMCEHSIRMASAHSRGKTAAAHYMDLQKFYDSVNHERMDAMVFATGFPKRIWRLAAKVYQGPRTLTWLRRSTGLIRVPAYMPPGITVTILNVIDDIGAENEAAGHTILHWLEWLDLPISSGKSLLLASSPDVLREIHHELGEPRIQQVDCACQLVIGAHVRE
eukprot:4334077-Amphidinium_carterae.1